MINMINIICIIYIILIFIIEITISTKPYNLLTPYNTSREFTLKSLQIDTSKLEPSAITDTYKREFIQRKQDIKTRGLAITMVSMYLCIYINQLLIFIYIYIYIYRFLLLLIYTICSYL
jgi:hypothetical protein